MPDKESEFDRRLSSKFIVNFSDYCGRRSGIDRRVFLHSLHFPARRFGIDRRSSRDQTRWHKRSRNHGKEFQNSHSLEL